MFPSGSGGHWRTFSVNCVEQQRYGHRRVVGAVPGGHGSGSARILELRAIRLFGHPKGDAVLARKPPSRTAIQTDGRFLGHSFLTWKLPAITQWVKIDKSDRVGVTGTTIDTDWSIFVSPDGAAAFNATAKKTVSRLYHERQL
jgi:hypothetical protein